MIIEAEVAVPLLQAVGMAQAKDEALGETEFEQLATELDVSLFEVKQAHDAVEHAGLALLSDGPPLLLKAGRQYLDCGGDVPGKVLAFLPSVIDDLHAREALMSAGSVLVDEFQHALLSGRGVEHARELVPAAFTAAITESITLRLFAAAAALMARFSDETPAGCVAEEIIAVRLIQDAEAWLLDEAQIGQTAADTAIAELKGLFELFEDDDVLALFGMSEPGDAAVAGHDPINRQMGVADQRIEAWFKPFGGVAPTGHLDVR